MSFKKVGNFGQRQEKDRRQKLEWCIYKPKNAKKSDGNCQELGEQGMQILLVLSEGTNAADVLIWDFQLWDDNFYCVKPSSLWKSVTGDLGNYYSNSYIFIIKDKGL